MTQQKQTQSYLVPFIIMVVLMALVGLITNLDGQFQAPMQAAVLQKSGSLTNADHLRFLPRLPRYGYPQRQVHREEGL